MTFMVVDTDSYDVLLGLDFLIKIGAIVDVERGRIQVRHGPGPNMEVLPLTMVNMMESLNSEPLMQNDSRSAEGVSGFMGRPCVNEDTKTQQMDVQVSSSDSDTSGDCDKECQRPRSISDESEFGNTELEELVLMEGPQ
jgi:hypothetical protein